MSIKNFILLFLVITFFVNPIDVYSEDVDYEFYASLRFGLDFVDADSPDNAINGRDFLSRFGVKGQSQISDSLTAIGNLEYGIRDDNLVDISQNNSPKLRLALIGVESNFGNLYYGSQTLLWHKLVRSAYFSDSNDTLRQGAIRDDDLIQYYYESGKVLFAAGLQFEGQDGDSLDQTQLGIQYKGGINTLQAAISYDSQGEANDSLIGVRYWFKPIDYTISAYVHYAGKNYDLYSGSFSGNIGLRSALEEGNVRGVPACNLEERYSSGVYVAKAYEKYLIHTRIANDHCQRLGDVNSIKLEYVRFMSGAFRFWLSYEKLFNDDSRLPDSISMEEMSEWQLAARIDF